MENDEKLRDPNSKFFGAPLEYSMASFAYYNCFKCKVLLTCACADVCMC